MNLFTLSLQNQTYFFYEKKMYPLLLLHVSKIVLNKVNASEPTLKILNSIFLKLEFSKKHKKKRMAPTILFVPNQTYFYEKKLMLYCLSLTTIQI